jgi:hypothetical protein
VLWHPLPCHSSEHLYVEHHSVGHHSPIAVDMSVILMKVILPQRGKLCQKTRLFSSKLFWHNSQDQQKLHQKKFYSLEKKTFKIIGALSRRTVSQIKINSQIKNNLSF